VIERWKIVTSQQSILRGYLSTVKRRSDGGIEALSMGLKRKNCAKWLGQQDSGESWRKPYCQFEGRSVPTIRRKTDRDEAGGRKVSDVGGHSRSQ